MRRNGSDDSLTVDDEYYTSGKSANNDFTLSTDTSPPCSLRLLREASVVEGEGEEEVEGEGEGLGQGQGPRTGDVEKASDHKSSVSVGSSSKSGRDNGNDNAAGSTNETVDTGRSDSTLTVAGNNALLAFLFLISSPFISTSIPPLAPHHFTLLQVTAPLLYLRIFVALLASLY